MPDLTSPKLPVAEGCRVRWTQLLNLEETTLEGMVVALVQARHAVWIYVAVLGRAHLFVVEEVDLTVIAETFTA